MSITPEDAGTTTERPSDPTGATPETPVADGGGETVEQLKARISELDTKFQQQLREKTNYEQTRRELDDLKARLGQSTPPTGSDPRRERFERGRAQLEAAADAGDDWAVTVLGVMDAIPMMQDRFKREIQLSKLDDSERVEVEALQREMWETRGDRISPATARDLLKQRKPPEARPAPDPQPRPMGTRTVPAPAVSQEVETMTYSAFGAAARSDPATRAAVQSKLKSGKLKLVAG